MSRGDFDVLVTGGGIVGATAAALLARSGFNVALAEAARPPAWNEDEPVGLRVSAVSPGSQSVLEQAGAWSLVTRHRHCAYRRMRIEDRSPGDVLEFEAPSHGLERLGTIVENDLLRSALWSVLDASPLVDLNCPARLVEIQQSGSAVEAALDDGSVLRARMVLAADGPGSPVRRLASIREDVWEYGQQGLVCMVRKQRPNPGIAWQRFLSDGPLAFLPLDDGRSSIVWTLPAARAKSLLGANESAFIGELEEASEGWLGATREVGPRAAFPLAMRLSRQYVSGRIILLGDAAHVVHPLAGQGVNLGLADVAALVETLLAARRAGEDLADAARLDAWQRWRRSESRLMAGGIHVLGGLFGSEWLSPLRRLGLSMSGRSWLASDAFVRRAAGVHRRAPRLCLGEPLSSLMAAGGTQHAATG